MLRRRENAIGNETADGGWAEREDCGRLFDCCLAAVGMLAVTINGDVVLMAQGANTPPCPAITPTGRLAGSIEQRGNRLVWHGVGARMRGEPTVLVPPGPWCQVARMEAGFATRIMRLSTSAAMAVSPCWAGKMRARSFGPMIAL